MAVTGSRSALLPLFLVSLASLGFEIALTRYFAVAKWSEYGYWVISIVLAGFSFSGVVMALFRDFFARRGPAQRLFGEHAVHEPRGARRQMRQQAAQITGHFLAVPRRQFGHVVDVERQPTGKRLEKRDAQAVHVAVNVAPQR